MNQYHVKQSIEMQNVLQETFALKVKLSKIVQVWRNYSKLYQVDWLSFSKNDINSVEELKNLFVVKNKRDRFVKQYELNCIANSTLCQKIVEYISTFCDFPNDNGFISFRITKKKTTIVLISQTLYVILQSKNMDMPLEYFFKGIELGANNEQH